MITYLKNFIGSQLNRLPKYDKRVAVVTNKAQTTIYQNKVEPDETPKFTVTENTPQTKLFKLNEFSKAIEIRKSTDAVQEQMSAEVVDSILANIINTVGMRQGFTLTDRLYTKYQIHYKHKSTLTYVVKSPMVEEFLSSTPLTYVAIKTKYSTMFPVACILSYFWLIHSSCKDLTDVHTLINVYTRCYMDTINCIQVIDPNMHFENDCTKLVTTLTNAVNTHHINDVPYIDKFLSAYEKSVAVYIKTKVSMYSYITGTLEAALSDQNMTMRDFLSICIMTSISKDMPDEVIINNEHILRILGESIAIAFTAVL